MKQRAAWNTDWFSALTIITSQNPSHRYTKQRAAWNTDWFSALTIITSQNPSHRYTKQRAAWNTDWFSALTIITSQNPSHRYTKTATPTLDSKPLEPFQLWSPPHPQQINKNTNWNVRKCLTTSPHTHSQTRPSLPPPKSTQHGDFVTEKSRQWPLSFNAKSPGKANRNFACINMCSIRNQTGKAVTHSVPVQVAFMFWHCLLSALDELSRVDWHVLPWLFLLPWGSSNRLKPCLSWKQECYHQEFQTLPSLKAVCSFHSHSPP